MKKIILSIVALFALTSALPQEFESNVFAMGGVKAGLVSTRQNISISGLTDPNIFSDEATIGYQAGLVGRLEFALLPVFVQTELLYSWNKLRSQNPKTISDVELSSFSAPLLAGFGIGNSRIFKIRLNAGPVFNIVSDVKIGDANWKVIETALKKPVVTWSAGFGIDILSVMIDIRYNGQFSYSDSAENGITVKTNPQSWTYSIGFLF